MAHGSCKDCEKEIDLIVHRDQVLGPEELICPECKVKRIQIKARTAVDEIKKSAAELRAARDEQLRLFDGKDRGTGEKLAKVSLLEWDNRKDEDGDFYVAKSNALTIISGFTFAPATYRIQPQHMTNPDTGSEARMFVLCGDACTVPEDVDDVAYLSLEMAQKKCEAIEADALAANVREKIGATEEAHEEEPAAN